MANSCSSFDGEPVQHETRQSGLAPESVVPGCVIDVLLSRNVSLTCLFSTLLFIFDRGPSPARCGLCPVYCSQDSATDGLVGWCFFVVLFSPFRARKVSNCNTCTARNVNVPKCICFALECAMLLGLVSHMI